MRWKTKAERCTSRLSLAPAKTGHRDPFSEIMDMMTGIDEMLRKKIAQLVALRKRIEEVIDGLDSVCRQMMRLRYFKNWGWEKIAQELCYSEQRIMQLHNKALAAIGEK